MAQRNQRDPDDEITVGFKTAQRYAAWVHQAAAKQVPPVSASKYLERIVLESAAADLGVPETEVRAALTPRVAARELVVEAARIAGVSPREFAKHAAAEAARALLGSTPPAKQTQPPPKSSRRASGTMRRMG